MNSQEAFPKGAPPIDPEMAVVAQKGIDKGYKILPHKLMEPGVLKSMGETAEEVPFGGVYDHNKKTFNTDVANQIGADAGVTKVTPGVLKKALNTHGDVIGERMSEVTLPLKDIETTLTKTTESLRELEPTVGAPVKGFIDRLREHAAENNGVIPGNVLQQYIADLGKRARRTSDMNLRGELTDLRETLLDAALEKITDPTKKAQLLDARMKYAKGMTIEPMVAKLKLGGILPEDLIGALKKNNGNHRLATQAAGELGETATIAENFITIKPESTVKTRGWLREAAGDIASGVGAVTVGPLYKKFGPGIAERKIAANQPPPPPAAPPPVAPKPLALGYTPEGIPIPEQQQNWQYGMNGDPVPPTFGAEVPPSGAPRLPAPSAAPVKDFKYRQKEAAAAAEDAKIKSTEESAPRKSTSGEVPLDLDPVTGKLKPVSAGVKGATPEVWQADTGANLKSASEKVAAGKRFDMTAAEKVAWDKTVVDLAEVGPEFKALSPKAVAEKMRDRDWVQSAVDKAREKAKGFDAIMERATAKAREQDILFKNHEASVAAEKANEASRAARTRLMDLVEQLESSLSKPRPVKGTGQGPKTRAARKAEAGMARKIAGYKMDGSPFYEGGEDVIITGTGK
jgi:hypothetical protein